MAYSMYVHNLFLHKKRIHVDGVRYCFGSLFVSHLNARLLLLVFVKEKYTLLGASKNGAREEQNMKYWFLN
jgi:hypothetical protein